MTRLLTAYGLSLALLLAGLAHATSSGFGANGAGASDQLSTGYTTHGTLRTYAGWAYQTDQGGGQNGRVFDKRTGADAQVELFHSTDFVVEWCYERDWTTPGIWCITPPSQNAWHHWAVTYDAGSTSNVPSLYIDGILQSLSSSSQPTGTLQTNTSSYVVGNRANDQARAWDGYHAEFAIWNRLLSVSEVKQAMRCGPKSVPGLVLNMPMGLFAGRNYVSAGITGSLTGTTTVSNGPPISYPPGNPCYTNR
jgi:hypothetical protein